mgnify:CR=1 FL=1
MTENIIESSCHCGALKLQINAEAPSSLTTCNCSVCKRYGSIHAYFHPSNVKVIAKANSIQEYSWGDKALTFIRCRNCGCYSHWRSLDSSYKDRMGVNARLFTNLEIDKIPARRFDGADTWKFLD